MSCGVYCVVFFTLPHGTLGWPAVCDCGISWSYLFFYIDLHSENKKRSSCLIPLGLGPWYLVCSITQRTTFKFV